MLGYEIFVGEKTRDRKLCTSRMSDNRCWEAEKWFLQNSQIYDFMSCDFISFISLLQSSRHFTD